MSTTVAAKDSRDSLCNNETTVKVEETKNSMNSTKTSNLYARYILVTHNHSSV